MSQRGVDGAFEVNCCFMNTMKPTGTSQQMNKIIHSFHVKNTPKKGFGIFARENIQRGAFLFEYAGYASLMA